MKGLLIKEFIMFRKNCIAPIIFLIFIMFAEIMGQYQMIVFAPIFISIIPSSYMTFDETSRWDIYSLIIPAKRSNIVSSKYIFTLILISISIILAALSGFIGLNIDKENEFVWSSFLSLIEALIIVGLIFPMIMLPLNFKLGTAKARIATMIFAGFIGGSTAIFANSEELNLALIFSDMSCWTKIIIAAAVAMLFLISWELSILFYNKREF
ncbi:MAG: ABC-2 transporter permease [Ruminococcus flavefaciens]|nr:ABC-2 transporter permease [Ruminococcus flavefaciens]